MNLQSNLKDPHTFKMETPGTSGLNSLWEGPLDMSSYPKGKGSSRGKNGMVLNQSEVPYACGPITMRAKSR